MGRTLGSKKTCVNFTANARSARSESGLLHIDRKDRGDSTMVDGRQESTRTFPSSENFCGSVVQTLNGSMSEKAPTRLRQLTTLDP